MLWSDIRTLYPDKWLIIEALDAYTNKKNQRKLKDIAIIDICSNNKTVMKSYKELHKQYPQREFYYVNTNKDELDIREKSWIGIRRGYEN
jgi:hypothetical protein